MYLTVVVRAYKLCISSIPLSFHHCCLIAGCSTRCIYALCSITVPVLHVYECLLQNPRCRVGRSNGQQRRVINGQLLSADKIIKILSVQMQVCTR